MEIKINEKTYKLNFGIMFLRKLDAVHYIEEKGIKIGFGLNSVVPGLISRNAATLSEVLYYALWLNKDRPTQAQVDEFLENDANVEQLFHEVLIELQKSNVTRSSMKNLKGSLPEADKIAEQTRILKTSTTKQFLIRLLTWVSMT